MPRVSKHHRALAATERECRVEVDCATRDFCVRLAHAERMEVRVSYAWDAVNRARERLKKARFKFALAADKPRAPKGK